MTSLSFGRRKRASPHGERRFPESRICRSTGGSPLRGICFLKQAEENRIGPLSGAGALAMLLNNTWRPGSSRSMERLLDMVEQVMAEIPLYEMACTREPQAARMACAVMKGT